MKCSVTDAAPSTYLNLWLSSLSSDICYNIALCHYKLRQYALSLKYITEIIERGIKEHPGKTVNYLYISNFLQVYISCVKFC